jgi:DNA modification methylase
MKQPTGSEAQPPSTRPQGARKLAAVADSPWRSRIVRHGVAAPAELAANPDNWRRHPPGQRDAVSGMLAEVGWVQDVIVNERTGHLVDGHLRVELAVKRKEASVPALYVDLSPEEERLVLAALDPLAGMAQADSDAFGKLMAGVQAGDGALRAMLEEVAAASRPARPAGKTDPDAAPTKPAKPYVRVGDLYELGGHRVLCGDATHPKDLARLLGGARPDLAFTDPPYNMNYRSKHLGGIANDRLDEPAFVRLILAAVRLMLEALRAGGSYYVCMSGLAYPLVAHQLRKIGATGRPLIWAKPSAGLGQSDYRPQFEVLLYGFTGKRSLRTWNGARKASDLWEFDAGRGVVARPGPGSGMTIELGSGVDTVQVELQRKSQGRVVRFDGGTSDLWRFNRETGGAYLHPTQKPVALVERAVENSSRVGDAVIDQFLGSGTTLIVAERQERRCYGVELDPKYAEVAIERWKAFTGKKARKL